MNRLDDISSGGISLGAIAFSTDSQELFATNLDNSIFAWTIDGVLTNSYRILDDRIRSICIDNDGKRLISGSDKSGIVVWDIASPHQLHKFVDSSGVIFDTCLSNDQQILVSTNWTRQVIQGWDYVDRKLSYELGWGYVVLPTKQSLLMVLRGRTISIYDLLTGELSQSLELEFSVLESFAVSANNLFAFILNNGNVAMWNMDTGRLECELNMQDCQAKKVTFSPSGQKIAIACSNSLVKIYDTKSASKLFEDVARYYQPNYIIFNSDETILASSGGGRTGGIICLWRD